MTSSEQECLPDWVELRYIKMIHHMLCFIFVDTRSQQIFAAWYFPSVHGSFFFEVQRVLPEGSKLVFRRDHPSYVYESPHVFEMTLLEALGILA